MSSSRNWAQDREIFGDSSRATLQTFGAFQMYKILECLVCWLLARSSVWWSIYADGLG